MVGELASKANSRKLVTVRGRPMFIKSQKARDFEKLVAQQAPVLSPMLGGKLRLTARIFYASERPDLDESLLMDCLQGRIYGNDRQVREKHIFHAIDRENPRCVIKVEEITELPFAGEAA